MSIFYLPAYLLVCRFFNQSVWSAYICSVCLFLYLSGCLFIISLSAYLVCLLVYLVGSLSITLSAYRLHLSVFLPVSVQCSPISLSAYLVCMLVYLSGSLSISLSAYLLCLPVVLSFWLFIHHFVCLPVSFACYSSVSDWLLIYRFIRLSSQISFSKKQI